MSHVMCHMSCVTRHMSHFKYQVSHVKFNFCLQSCGASWWRVCYQRGIPRLVLIHIEFMDVFHLNRVSVQSRKVDVVALVTNPSGANSTPLPNHPNPLPHIYRIFGHKFTPSKGFYIAWLNQVYILSQGKYTIKSTLIFTPEDSKPASVSPNF